MQICKEGYLNDFVKSTTEGGLGLCEWIADKMVETRAYSAQEIYDGIQISGQVAAVKELTKKQINLIMEWMIGKTFNEITFGKITTQQITYIVPESE